MDNLMQLEQELEALAAVGEADLEPNIPEQDDYGDSDMDIEDAYISESFDEDNVESLLEVIDVEDFDEDYDEGRRREKSNQKRSKANHRRSVTNQRNILRINRDLGRVKKKGHITHRQLAKHVKRSRILEKRNYHTHKKIMLNVRRVRQGVISVGRRTTQNAELLELMGLMAIPRLVGNLVSGQINELVVEEVVATTDASGNPITQTVERTFNVVDQSNDLLASLAPSIPDLTALVGRYTNANKYVLVGVAVLLSALMGGRAIARTSK